MKKIEPIAVDLLWLRPGKVGGTEFYIRNLLDGLCQKTDNFNFYLLVSKDNIDSFRHYKKDERIKLLETNVVSANIAKRILWQNLFQSRLLKKRGIRKCFVPVYCKPWLNGGIEYLCVIHDLQAYHYPAYHPFHEIAYSRLCWRMDVWNARGIIAISNWVKQDILSVYHSTRKEIQVIYNPIHVKKEEVLPFSSLQEKFNIEEKQFYYTVSQLIPHKNLHTIIKVMEQITRRKLDLPKKLLITGVNGNAAIELQRKIKEMKLEEQIILTGFLENEERNTLYKSCRAFLFPSIFEGFGMPPIEAMLFGTTVITTKCASIPEVTQGKADYVEDPYDVEQWITMLQTVLYQKGEVDFDVYSPERIATQYLSVFDKVFS